MEKKSNAAVGGVGFFGALAIVFIVLKLVGVINWSWVWVLCPIWGQVILWPIVFGVAVLIMATSRWDKL